MTEVGDFIAHRDRRDRGETHRYARAMLMCTRAISALQSGDSEGLSVVDIAAQASLRLHDEQTLLDEVGVNKANAASMLGRMRSKRYGVKQQGGRRELNQKEQKLLSLLIKEAPARPIFTPERLVGDLGVMLVEGEIIRPHQLEDFVAIEDLVSAFTVSVMHGSVIGFDDGATVGLHGHSEAGMPVSVWAGIEVKPPYPNTPFRIMVPAFLTRLDSAVHCSRALQGIGEWRGTVELNSAGLLDYVS
ncbi:hypothetical protein [Caulobacter sp. BK020]|uniref:hypothetical protein n=1 Tax=Caulobacter sp. BK020 TaxID=2512117 RepID=UPI001042EC44|nr:hypothetical protein [Caulobacter sp. BK020]